MKVNIAFFHIGSKTWLAEMLCRSAKAVFRDEDIRTIQLSNNESPKTKSADLILRSSNFKREQMMYSRMVAYKDCLRSLAEPTIFLDTDILIVRKFFVDTSLGPLLCKREYELEKKLPPYAMLHGKTKVRFDEQGGIAVGKIYPYLGCFYADHDPSFLEYALDVYESLDPKYHFWYGDQIALREAAKKFNIRTLPESQIACNPSDFTIENQNTKALHFKGTFKKDLMNNFYLKIFPSKHINLKTSFRSNPNKVGFEIPNTLNPYFRDYLAGASSVQAEFINPQSLDIGLRSDILCKVMYLLSTKLHLLPELEGIYAYNKSISSLNGFKGFDSPHKTSPNDYYSFFLNLFDELKESQILDPVKSAVPIDCNHVPIDGSHRVSLAIALEINVPVIKLPVKHAPSIPFSHLTSRFGLSSLETLLAIRTYIRYKNDVQIFVLFPSRNTSKDQSVFDLIRRYFRIEESIKVPISCLNQTNELVKNLYPDSAWLGSRDNDFEGLKWKSKNVFLDGANALFLVCASDPRNYSKNQGNILKDIKEIVRSTYGIGFHSIHSTDSVDEKILLWDNFVLNEICGQKNRHNGCSSKAQVDLLTNEQKLFIDILANKPLSERERTVVSGGFSLALLGIRATKDIDLITDLNYGSKVDIHNTFVEKYGDCDSFYDFISDPLKTFWLMHQGKAIRIISLLELHKIKLRRIAEVDSKKDFSDVKRIEEILLSSRAHS